MGWGGRGSDARHRETAPPSEAVGHEVEGPALVRPLRDRHRRTACTCPLAASTLTHCQPLLWVDAVELLPVHVPALPLKLDVRAALSEPASLSGQLALENRLPQSADVSG